MTGTALQNLWVTAESLSPAETELAAHATGSRSTGFDICVGMDGRRRRHLLVPLPHGSASAPPFRSTGLFVSTRALLREGVEHNYLDLVCRSEEMNGAFSSLVLDVLQQMSTNEPDRKSVV